MDALRQNLWKMLDSIGRELDLNVGETGVSNGQWIIVQDNRITLSIFGREKEGEEAIKKIKSYLKENGIESSIEKSKNDKIFNFILKF